MNESGGAGHVAIAVDLRIKLGTDESFYQKVTQQLLSYLKSIAKNGNHMSMPHLLAPIVGVQCGVIPRTTTTRRRHAPYMWRHGGR